MITGFSVDTVDELGNYEYGGIQWMGKEHDTDASNGVYDGN